MKRPELVVENGELAGRRFPIVEGGIRLGRSSSNNICIPDEELSRNHCLFEPFGETGVRVTDLASANGTFVNGTAIGSESVELKPGDVIEVGTSRLRISDDESTTMSGGVDLGLGTIPSEAESGSKTGTHPRRNPIANLLWIVLVLILASAIYLVLFSDLTQSSSPIPEAREPVETVSEMRYEKVIADSASIFRYYMTFSAGVLKVVIDDLSQENRHIVKNARLTDAASARLNEILTDSELVTLDREYAGPETEPPELKSWGLRILYTTKGKSIHIVNTQEPEVFRRVREKLEAFANNELGLWAIQYSREKLLEMASAEAESARMKWEDREVEYGNIHAAICAYRKAIAYLDTVNPKPKEFNDYRSTLEEAEKLLNERYADQRFRADQAIKLSDWETAKRELLVLCELVPDRDDDRYREASAKLMDVEKRIGKGGAR